MAADEVTVRAELEGNAAKGLKEIEQQADRTRRSLGRLVREKASSFFDRMDVAAGRFGTSLSGIDKKASRFSSWLTNGLARGAEVAAKGLTALVAGTTFFALKAASSFEQTRIALNGFLGSAAAGGKMFAELQQLNLKTPFELGDISSGARQLLGFGFAGRQVVPIMKAATDAAAGLGAGSEGLGRILLNLGQVRTMGKVTGRELRDFATIGFPGYELVASILGKTREEIQAMGEDATVSGDAFISAVTGMQGPLQRFAGMAEQQMTSLAGMWSNLKDAVNVRLADAASPLVQELKTLMPSLTGLVGSAIDTLAPPVARLLGTLANGLTRLLPVAEPVLFALATGLGDLASAAGPLVTALQPVGEELGRAITEFFTALVPLMPDLASATAELAMVAPAFVRALTDLVPLVHPVLAIVDGLLGLGPVPGILGAGLVALSGYRMLRGLAVAAQAFAGALWETAAAETAVTAASGGALGATGAAGAARGLFGTAAAETAVTAAGGGAGAAGAARSGGLTVLGKALPIIGGGVLAYQGTTSKKMSLANDAKTVGGFALAGAGLGLLGGPLAPLTSGAGALIGGGVGLGAVVGKHVLGHLGGKKSSPAATAMPASSAGNISGSYNTTQHANSIVITTNDPETMQRRLEQFFAQRDERGAGLATAGL